METGNTQRKPTYFTLGEASKQTGKSKSTLSKAIKTGKLSVSGKEDNSYKIEASELFRAFPPNNSEQKNKHSPERLDTPIETGRNTLENSELRLRLELAHERIADRDKQIKGLEVERDTWREQAQRLALPRPPETPVKAENSAAESVVHLSGPPLPENQKHASTGKFWRVTTMILALVLVVLIGGSYFLAHYQPETQVSVANP